jgi:acyl-CoA thioesterase-2
MSQVLEELLALLKLETIEQGIYRGQSQDLGYKALFGGQVMGQALSAAKETLSEDRMVHSLHSYFLRPGDASKPVVYDVENIRDGKSFSTRRVQAIQNGKPIFYMTASFQIEEQGLEHQAEMPKVEQPENLASLRDYYLENLESLPTSMHDKVQAEMPIEIRPVEMYDWLKLPIKEPVNMVWMKANGDMPDDARIHKYLLAYASDFQFLPTALYPHGKNFMAPNFQTATIDHAMWFHHDFRFDDWLLYAVESTSSSVGRGLVRGQFFNRQGKLVASTIQEGVIRQR